VILSVSILAAGMVLSANILAQNQEQRYTLEAGGRGKFDTMTGEIWKLTGEGWQLLSHSDRHSEAKLP